jgi:hypothetical protein
MNKTAIEKRAGSVLDRAKALLKELTPQAQVTKAGGHSHGVSQGAATTELNGDHFHMFVLPVSIRFQPEGGGTVEIPAGTELKTETGGPHSHRVQGGQVVGEMSAHRHVIPVRGGYELFTETDGEHDHSLVDGRTAPDGEHDHQLRLGDRTISSKEAKRLDPAVCSIAQSGSIDEISAEVLSSPDSPPVIVWQAEPPSGALPALKLPDPQFIIDRLLDGKPAGLLSIRRRARRVGQPQLLVNEVGPLGMEKAFVWAVVAHGEPVQIENVAALSVEDQQGLDRFTRLEFDEGTDLFHLPLELAVVFDPPLELSKPPGGRRFGSTVDLEKDVVRSRQISIEEMLRDVARRRVHDFINDPSTNTLRRATTGHLLEIDRQLHMLFERAFASKDVTREEGVTRDDTVAAHEFVMRELGRRRVETDETDVLAVETRALLQLQEEPEISILVGKRLITVSELRTFAGKQEPTTIQTLIFSKEIFSREEAVAWAKEHDFHANKVDETENTFRLRQREPNEFQEGSFRTIELTDGVQAVIGVLKEASKADDVELAEWSAAFINDLPDSAFLLIEPGGEKDAEGKTTPRSLRHLPVRDENGELDIPHLRNAISRIPQLEVPGLTAEDKQRLQDKARRLLEEAQKAAGCGVRILKQHEATEEEERYVFGVVLVPDEVDAQGDTYDAPTIRKAAHSFMENGQHNKIMHDGRPVQGVTVLETYLAKQMETHGGETFPVGTWFLAVRVNNDDIWKAIRGGAFTGFSMGGTAVREALS